MDWATAKPEVVQPLILDFCTIISASVFLHVSTVREINGEPSLSTESFLTLLCVHVGLDFSMGFAQGWAETELGVFPDILFQTTLRSDYSQIRLICISGFLTRSLISLFFNCRKPRPVSQLVAQQVTQQFASPTHPKKEKKEKTDKEKSEKEPTLKRNSHKKMRSVLSFHVLMF